MGAAPQALTKYDAQIEAWKTRIAEIDSVIFLLMLEYGEIFYQWKYKTESMWVKGGYAADESGYYEHVAMETGKSKRTVDACLSLKRNYGRLLKKGNVEDEQAKTILAKALVTFGDVRSFTGALSSIPDSKLPDVVSTVEHWTGDPELMIRSLREIAGKKVKPGGKTGSRTGHHAITLEADGLKILGNPSPEFVKAAARVTNTDAFQVSEDRVLLRAKKKPAPPEPEPKPEEKKPEEKKPEDTGGSVNAVWNPVFRPWAVRMAEETGIARAPGHLEFEAWLHEALTYFDENILSEGQTVMDFLQEAAQQQGV